MNGLAIVSQYFGMRLLARCVCTTFLLLTPLWTGCLWAAEPLAVFDLQEHLGRNWPAELIHDDCVFAPGRCRSTSVLVQDNRGQEWVAQMSDTARHADGLIQRAKVWWVVSLQPDEHRQFRLQPAGTAAGGELTLSHEDDTLEVDNGLVGARFHLGEKHFASSARASEIPAFLQKLKLRGGAWTGHG